MEDIQPENWADLDAREQIVWGRLCRRLQREHGLERVLAELSGLLGRKLKGK